MSSVFGEPARLPQRILRQGRHETLAMLRNGEQLTLAVLLPLMALIALVVTPLLDDASFSGQAQSRIDIAAPGILALCAMSTAFTGQGIATGFDRRYGVLRLMSTTPLGRTGLIVGKILAVLAVLVIQVAMISLFAALLGWRPQLAVVLLAGPLLVLGALCFTSLGLLIAGTARPEATLALANLLGVLFGALGGIVLPPDRLPGLMRNLVYFLPSGALGDALRWASIGGVLNLWDVAVLLIWAALATFGAIKWFKWS